MSKLADMKAAWQAFASRWRAIGASAVPTDAAAVLVRRSGHHGLVSYVTGDAQVLAAGEASPQNGRYRAELRFTGVALTAGGGLWVRILDSQDREVVTVPDCGPALLVDLPPGRYRAQAVRGGCTEIRGFVVARDKRVQLIFD